MSDAYKADIYKVNIQSIGHMYEIEISNVISWDIISIKLTRDELLGLVEYISDKISMQSMSD